MGRLLRLVPRWWDDGPGDDDEDEVMAIAESAVEAAKLLQRLYRGGGPPAFPDVAPDQTDPRTAAVYGLCDECGARVFARFSVHGFALCRRCVLRRMRVAGRGEDVSGHQTRRDEEHALRHLLDLRERIKQAEGEAATDEGVR